MLSVNGEAQHGPRLVKSGKEWKLLPASGKHPNNFQHPKPLSVKTRPPVRRIVQERKVLTPIREHFGPFLPKRELQKVGCRFIMPSLLEIAVDVFGIPQNHIVGQRRSRSIARARFAIMVFLVDNTEWSLPMIGRAFKRDHTTVISATRSIGNHMAADPDYADMIEIFNHKARKLLEGGA